MIRTLRVFAVASIAVTGWALPAASQDGCQGSDRVVPVSAWGRPGTTFSTEPATTFESVKTLFARYEQDLRTVLALAEFQGNPDDLFRAVANAQEGDGTITAESFPSRSEFEWMAFRKKGQPACVRHIIWAADKPFPGWKITFESGGWEYTFAVPQKCLNLAFQRGEKRALPPTCELSVSFDREANRITVRGSTDGERIEITSASGPSGALAPGDLTSAGSGSWTLEPKADGTYTFGAVATAANGTTTRCEAKVSVEIQRPVCRIDASVDPATGVITVSTAGSVGEVELTGYTDPSGSAGNVAAFQSAGAGRWTYATAGTLPKKPGSYSYSFTASASLHGYRESCKANATVTKEGWEGKWIARGYGAKIYTSGDHVTTSSGGGPIAIFEGSDLAIDNGSGFGLGLEYLASPRIGIEADALFGSFEAPFMYDLADAWGMDEDDVDFRPLSLGVNFHLTPGRRVDVYVGPFVSIVQYGDASYQALRPFRASFDDDTAFGAKLGLDVPFSWTSPWLFTSNLRYLGTSLEPTGADRRFFGPVDVDPWIVTAGLGYRF